MNKLVAIVDGDESMCGTLRGLLKAVRMPAHAFAPAATFPGLTTSS